MRTQSIEGLATPSDDHNHMSRIVRKSVCRILDKARHKPGCTATEFRIYEVEGLYSLSSENKGADQLCTANQRLSFHTCKKHRAADLCLCFLHMQKASFLMTQLIIELPHEKTNILHLRKQRHRSALW